MRKQGQSTKPGRLTRLLRPSWVGMALGLAVAAVAAASQLGADPKPAPSTPESAETARVASADGGGAIAYSAWDPSATPQRYSLWRMLGAGGGAAALVPSADSGAPVISPDRLRVAYAAGPGNAASVWTVAFAGGSPVKVADVADADITGVTWSSDSSRVIYAAGGVVYSVSAAGGSPTALTTGTGARYPSVCGARLVYSRRGGASGEFEAVYSQRLSDGGDVVKLSGGETGARQPVCSPDGTRVAYVSGSGVSVTAAATAASTSVATDVIFHPNRTASWCGSGSTADVVYSTNSGIYRSGARITTGAGQQPRCSPDGSRVAWIDPTTSHMRAADSDTGANLTQLTSSRAQLPHGFDW